MLELFVYLLCGSILVSGILAVSLDSTLAAAASGG
jgi:energy-converting hydrogenase B subunit D